MALLDQGHESRFGAASVGDVAKHREVKPRSDAGTQEHVDLASASVVPHHGGLTGQTALAQELPPSELGGHRSADELANATPDQLLPAQPEQLGGGGVRVDADAAIIREQHGIERAV